MEQIPLVLIDGSVKQLPTGDTIKGVPGGSGVTEESAEEIAIAVSVALG